MAKTLGRKVPKVKDQWRNGLGKSGEKTKQLGQMMVEAASNPFLLLALFPGFKPLVPSTKWV